MILSGVLVLAACGDPAAGDDSGPASCTPGTQQACACPGGSPPGVQVCAPTGDQFGACMGCEGGDTDASSSGESGSDPSTTATATLTTTDDPSLTTTLGDDSSSTGTPNVPGDGIPDNPPQSVYPDPPPDGSAVVNAVAAEHPDWLTGSCVDQGGNNEFLFEVVRRLRMQDDRWGLNWKRGVIGDMSQDVVDYHYGEGVSEESTDVFIIDIIGGHCPKDATPPQPAWIDVTQATLDGGTVGMWTLAGQAL
jgi:hypothetical protein